MGRGCACCLPCGLRSMLLVLVLLSGTLVSQGHGLVEVPPPPVLSTSSDDTPPATTMQQQPNNYNTTVQYLEFNQTEVSNDSIYQNMDNRSWIKCPQNCYCDLEFVRIDCQNASLLQVPYAIPPQVQYLYLQDNILTDLTSDSFHSLHNLRVLDLSLNKLVTISPDTFTQVPNLEQLNLHGNLLNETAALVGLNHLHVLQVLNVSNNRITDLDGVFLNISNLDAGYNQLHSLPHLHAFPLLTALHLTHNQISNLTHHPTTQQHTNITDSTSHFTHTNISYIIMLDLSVNHLTHIDDDFFHVFPSLQKLDLSVNRLESIDFAWESPLTSLEFLNLSYNPLLHLPNNVFAACPNLTALQLSHMSRLTHINSASFANLTRLQSLSLDYNPELTYIHARSFSMLTSLHSLNLSFTGLTSLHISLFDSLHSVRSIDLSGVQLQCTCDTAWLQQWHMLNASIIIPSNLTCYSGEGEDQTLIYSVSQFPVWAMNCSGASIRDASHLPKKVSYEIGASAMFDCIVEGDPSPRVTWIASKSRLQFTYHPAFIDHSELEPGDPRFHQHHYWHGVTKYFSDIPLANRIFVLKNGSLYIDYVTRKDAGIYECHAKNHLGNETTVITVMTLDYHTMFETKIWCLVVGLGSAISFLILGLAAGLIRWVAHFCSPQEKEKRRSIKELLATIQEYKSEKVDVFRAYKTAKLDKISAFKNHKIDRLRVYRQGTVTSILAHMHSMREHYQGQMSKIKENYNEQCNRLRDNYGNHINKIKDYRAEKVETIRDNYQNQALKIRDYGSSQMQRLREQYKLQQQHMLKLLELLDIGNCMSVIEAECMRTESMLFDPNITFDLDPSTHPVHGPPRDLFLSTSDDSEYITAGSQSDVSQPCVSAHAQSPAQQQHRKSKHPHKRRSSSDASDTSSLEHSILTANLAPEIVEMLRQDRLSSRLPRRQRKKRKRHHSAQLHSSPWMGDDEHEKDDDDEKGERKKKHDPSKQEPVNEDSEDDNTVAHINNSEKDKTSAHLDNNEVDKTVKVKVDDPGNAIKKNSHELKKKKLKKKRPHKEVRDNVKEVQDNSKKVSAEHESTPGLDSVSSHATTEANVDYQSAGQTCETEQPGDCCVVIMDNSNSSGDCNVSGNVMEAQEESIV